MCVCVCVCVCLNSGFTSFSLSVQCALQHYSLGHGRVEARPIVRWYSFSSFDFHFQECLGYARSFAFLYNFYNLFNLCKIVCLDFYTDYTEFIDQFGREMAF